MTPDQALEHDWILEMKHKRDKDASKMASTSRKHRHHHHNYQTQQQIADNSVEEVKGETG